MFVSAATLEALVAAASLVAASASTLSSNWDPVWSPDGSRIAFVGRGRIGPPPDTCTRETALGLIDHHRANVTRLARGYHPNDPDWSPNGREIGFSSWTGGQPKLAVLTLDDRRVATIGSGRHPRWSPDGRRIVFARNGVLWRINRDGSNTRRLTPRP